MLNFDKYVINENVQRSKKILKDLNIPETNKNYLALKKLLSRNIGYLGKFTDWHFNQNHSVQRLQDLYKKIKESNLNKSIDEFKTPEDIIDFIIEKSKSSKENKIEKSIPKSIKHSLIYDDSNFEPDEDDLDYYESDIQEFNKFIKNISIKVPDNKVDILCNFLRNKAARCLDQDDPYDYLNDVIDTIINTNPDDIYKNIRNDNNKNLTILIDNDEYLFILCHDYQSCKKYGSKFWCIVEDESTFEEYTEDGVQSIFFFKDKIPFVDKESVLGMTINIKDYKISASHWEDDAECNLRDYEDDIYYSNPNSKKYGFYDSIINTISENKSIINKIYSISFEKQIENDPDKFGYFIRRSDDKTIFDFIKRKTFKKIVTDYEFEQLVSSENERIFNILFQNNYDISEVFDDDWLNFILYELSSDFFIKNYTKLISKEYILNNISSLIDKFHDDPEYSGKLIFLCSMFNIDLMPYYIDYLGDDDDADFGIDINMLNDIPNEQFMINYKLIIKYYSHDIVELSDDKLKLILIKEPKIFFKNSELFEIFLKDYNLYTEYKDKIIDKISKMNRKEITEITSVIINNDLDELYPFVIKNILPPKIMDKYDITYTKK